MGWVDMAGRVRGERKWEVGSRMWLVEAGWGTPRGDDVRLALRGAAIGTYQNLPPVLQWRRRATARERELLHASGR